MSNHLTIIFIILIILVAPARAQYKVEHMGSNINTAGSETAALQVGDTVLVYATLPPSTGSGAFGIKHKVTHLQQVRIAKNGKLARPKHDRWGFCSEKDHTGNPTLDPTSRDAYFTRGDVESLRCDIWWAPAKKRRGWEKARRLQGPVNDKQYTATQPAAGRLADGTTILYFVSNRPGGFGGMDIWYTLVTDGMASEPVNLGPRINTPADEMTPFYDQRNETLYFSSDRDGGLGGFDIYCAVGQRNTWQEAEPVCGCLNSEQNDLYFTIARHDSASGIPTVGYLSSNRKDSYFLSDSMCCNDIYRWSIDTAALLAMTQKPDTTPIPTPPAPPAPRFPLYLYFHNDDPDPWSRDSATLADYADCQLRYALMRSTYLSRQHSAHDSARMTAFFDSCVVGNFFRANELLELIARSLDEGHTAVLTVAGYASPIFHDDYNRVLSQRRIRSFINMIRAWQGGRLAEALANGRLRIEQQPMGAEKDSPVAPGDDPVYSLSAASSRRIEVRSCKIF